MICGTKLYSHQTTYGRRPHRLAKVMPMMNNAYRKGWSIIQNIFLPQQKLVQKIREGSMVRRWMSEEVTPLERIRALLPKKVSEVKATQRVNRSIQNKLSA